MDKAVFFLMTNVTIMVCLFNSLLHPTLPSNPPLFSLTSRYADFQREKEEKKSMYRC